MAHSSGIPGVASGDWKHLRVAKSEAFNFEAMTVTSSKTRRVVLCWFASQGNSMSFHCLCFTIRERKVTIERIFEIQSNERNLIM